MTAAERERLLALADYFDEHGTNWCADELRALLAEMEGKDG